MNPISYLHLLKTSLFFACLLIATISSGQSIEREVIATAGEHFENTVASLSWTIGEPITETVSDHAFTLTQGFHQSEISITAIDVPLSHDYQISIYPNPTTDIVNIDMTNETNEMIAVQIYDLNGRSVLTRKIQDSKIQISLRELATADYLLSLRKHNGMLISTYLINKTN